MKVKIQTLTPLWTGGVDGSMDRIHETGIIGSMRWWYEAIMRGLGKRACDPSRHECPDKDGNYCDVCRIFGATGWKRRFQVKIIDESKEIFQGNSVLIPSGHIHDKGSRKRAGGWYIGPGRLSRSFNGDTLMEFPIIMPDLKEQVLPTLMLIERWGGFGSKTQLGYGTVQFYEHEKNGWKPLNAIFKSGISVNLYNGSLPALNNIFFAKIRFKPRDKNWWNGFTEIRGALTGYVNGTKLNNPITLAIAKNWLASGAFPIAPIIRNWLRFTLFNGVLPNMQNFFLGTANRVCPVCYSEVLRPDRKNRNNLWCGNCYTSLPSGKVIERVASKIKISSAYVLPNSNCWEFRIWGWFPEQVPRKLLENGGTRAAIKRDVLLQTLHDAIRPHGSLWSGPFNHLDPCYNAFEWREFAAPERDAHCYGNSAKFFESLLGDANYDL